MNIEWNVNAFILFGGTFFSLIGSLAIMKSNWKQYGVLFILTALIGELLDLMFVKFGFYTYEYKIFPSLPNSPFTLIMTMFPLYILFGVKYSPTAWQYKIPFYMMLVHFGMLGEALSHIFTAIIEYNRFWDTWDSYIWWWLFLLGFELVGNLIVMQESRTPIPEDFFKYGRTGWYLTHFVFVVTIFLAGIYLGTKL